MSTRKLMGWECSREDKYRKAYKQYWNLNHISKAITRLREGVDIIGRRLMLYGDN